jgi:hypothetical protein
MSYNKKTMVSCDTDKVDGAIRTNEDHVISGMACLNFISELKFQMDTTATPLQCTMDMAGAPVCCLAFCLAA